MAGNDANRSDHGNQPVRTRRIQLQYSNLDQSRPEVFIPYQKFNGNYLKVLYHPEFPDILTGTEKKLLKYLNEKGFKNGKCYPKQTTIAWKLGISTKQVHNLTKSCEAKGFLLVERCEGVARHLFRRTNRYHFLWHPVYDAIMDSISAQISDQNDDSSFNRINSTSPTTSAKRVVVPAEDPEQKTARYQTELDTLCDKISMRVTPSGSRFNPLSFRFKHLKLYGSDAVKEALEAILEKLESIRDTSIIKAFEWWGLGTTLLKTHKVMNEPTCTDWLGDDYRPPDKLPGNVANLLPGLVKSF